MHSPFLLAALNQAQKGRGFCSPNPAVGAVAVRQGEIVAEAWHQGAGTPHAEQLLLQELGEQAAGLTIYVTLEPCNHWGKTPPCTEAIVRAKVKKVVYAYKDPFPLVAENNTPCLLKEAGIEVEYAPLEAITRFYQSYAHWLQTGRPWVTVKLAQSLDAKAAYQQGPRLMLSNPACEQFTHQMRLQSDLILSSARTILLDDPLLNVRLSEQHCAKPIAILDRQQRLNSKAKILETAKEIHLYHDESLKAGSLHEKICSHQTPLKEGMLDLNWIISHLGKLGYHDVWVEVGPRLFSALHQAGCVQRTYLYVVPKIIGEAGLPVYSRFGARAPAGVHWLALDDNGVLCIDWSR